MTNDKYPKTYYHTAQQVFDEFNFAAVEDLKSPEQVFDMILAALSIHDAA